jgi:hypothetical protein
VCKTTTDTAVFQKQSFGKLFLGIAAIRKRSGQSEEGGGQ